VDANGFSNYIASGGGRHLMRSISKGHVRHPLERLIGSSPFADTSGEHGGTMPHKPEADRHDDGSEKPARESGPHRADAHS
jgi:hypothetical protein